ncbi:jg8699 [Pararge aegeria aegeria]|uniref:Thymocyte nuclear protein 1 n=1 Tax=Pararge aegeria aegeria TaxID=348720 RepID=A0A8S4SN10_9NEOP|nr:jg8699 [Pararge aegeria aegeria]
MEKEQVTQWNGVCNYQAQNYMRAMKLGDLAFFYHTALADDNLLHQLNLKFREIDKPTNVLSFPCEQLSSECDLGDIAIAVDTIERESHEYCISILTHTAHMLVHGLLHLLGYDHQKEDEEIIMKSLESKILALLEFEKEKYGR